MLTGDKLETASSIALSSHLVDRNQKLFIFKEVSTRAETHAELNQLRKHNETSLILSGNSLEVHLTSIFLISCLISAMPRAL
jgi:phospholipid-translocating ATPase